MGGSEDRKLWRVMSRLLALVLSCAGLLLAAGPAQAAVRGVVPGEFRYSLHEPVPLIEGEGEPEDPFEFERVLEPRDLILAPRITAAGAHPDLSLTVVTRVGNLDELFAGIGTTADMIFELPPGVSVNLAAFPVCPAAAFQKTVAGRGQPGCPADTQVGVVTALFGGELYDRTYPLYRVEAPPGHTAALGFAYALLTRRVPMTVTVDARTDGDFGLTLSRVTPPDFFHLLPVPFMTLWGVPGDPVHNDERLDSSSGTWGAALPAPHPALIANSADCGSGASEARLRLQYGVKEKPADIWFPEDPDDFPYRSFAPEASDCEDLDFDPRAGLSASSAQSDSSTGLALSLDLAGGEGAAEPASPPVQEAVLTLPDGVSLNPAAAGGLAVCTPEQVGLEGAGFPAPNPIRFTAGAADCPPASKLGSAFADLGLSNQRLSGAIYLAEPFENPFRSPWALYLVFAGPGPPIKLAARVDVDPETGQLTVTMDSLPQLPFEQVGFELSGGPGALLSTPLTCGTGVATLKLVPWSAPQSGPPVSIERMLGFESGSDGRRCSKRGPEPFSPALSVATENPVAAAASPFELRLQRRAGDQELNAFTALLPRGLATSIRGWGRCGEGETVCPADSRVGSLRLAAGTGPAPLLLRAPLYLTGPHGAAPLGLVAIAPVLAEGASGEPLFESDPIVVRFALRVDPRSGRLWLASGPLPQSLGGVPLRLREVAVRFGAEGFVRNPSSCEERDAIATVEGEEGGRADLRAGFQVGGCRQLRFAPELRLRSPGGNRPGQQRRLVAAIEAKPGDAGIAAAMVRLPAALGLDWTQLDGSCRPAQLASGSCPPDSRLGRAALWSPLLSEPLRGTVFLTASRTDLPGLALRFEGGIPLQIVGELSLRAGRLRVAFPTLPDLPFTRFAITVGSGGRDFLVNRQVPCARPDLGDARLLAHNGKVERRKFTLRVDCQEED